MGVHIELLPPPIVRPHDMRPRLDGLPIELAFEAEWDRDTGARKVQRWYGADKGHVVAQIDHALHVIDQKSSRHVEGGAFPSAHWSASRIPGCFPLRGRSPRLLPTPCRFGPSACAIAESLHRARG